MVKCPEGCRKVHGNKGKKATPAQLAALAAGRKKMCENMKGEGRSIGTQTGKSNRKLPATPSGAPKMRKRRKLPATPQAYDPVADLMENQKNFFG